MRALLWAAIVCGCLAGDVVAQPPPPTFTGPVRVGGNIRPPIKVRDVRPVYPELALSARVMGIVILEIHVGTDGTVSEARVLRGVPMLNDSALEAVKQWLYEPTLLNGKPVPVIMTVTVNFTLPDAPVRAEGIPIDAPGAPAVAATRAPVPSSDPFLVTPEGVGMIWVGMTQPALQRAVPSTQTRSLPRRTPRGLTTDIEIALEPGGPTALVANLDNAVVVQIDVRNNRFRTVEGFGVGTTLGELRRFDRGVRVVMCDRGPCAIMSIRPYTFELDASAASAAELAQVPDTATATSVLIARPVMRAPVVSQPVPQE